MLEKVIWQSTWFVLNPYLFVILVSLGPALVWVISILWFNFVQWRKEGVCNNSSPKDRNIHVRIQGFQNKPVADGSHQLLQAFVLGIIWQKFIQSIQSFLSLKVITIWYFWGNKWTGKKQKTKQCGNYVPFELQSKNNFWHALCLCFRTIRFVVTCTFSTMK